MSWMNDYDEEPESDDDRYAFRTATLGQRLLGALIDGVFNLAMLYAVRSGMSSAPTSWDDFTGMQAVMDHSAGTLIGWLLPLCITGWLVGVRGQSVGKIFVGTRIVDQDGRRVGILRGFALRTLPMFAIGLVPSVLLATGTPVESLLPVSLLVGGIALLDAGLIFGAYHRCLHDRIAGTYVAVAGTERPPKDEASRRSRKKKRRPARKAG